MESDYIQLNYKQHQMLQQHYDDRHLVPFSDNTGLSIVEIRSITRNDSRFSSKYEGHIPVVLDILRTYRIVDKQNFLLTLIKTGISYKKVDKPHEI